MNETNDRTRILREQDYRSFRYGEDERQRRQAERDRWQARHSRIQAKRALIERGF